MEAHSTCVKKRNHVTDCHTLKTCISCQSDQRYNGKMRTNDYSTGQTTLLPLAALSNNLARVLLIRCIVIAGLFIALYYCFAIARISLQYTLLSSLLVGFSLFTFFSFLRLNLKTPITQTEFVIQLLMDTCFITLLLYFSGGSSNPFVSYYLVPVTIAAATLRSVHTWLITLLSLAAYTLLLFFHTQIPEFLPPHHHAAIQGINLHIVGMWVGFAVSAILITFLFVSPSIFIELNTFLIIRMEWIVGLQKGKLGRLALAAGKNTRFKGTSILRHIGCRPVGHGANFRWWTNHTLNHHGGCMQS